MNVNDEYIVKVEKLVNEGAGFARIDNIPVFIDLACPDDLLKIKISKINKNYVTADIVDIIEPSKYRVDSLCALHKICGSCNWQFIDYKEQLRQKRNIVYETIKNISGIDINIEETIPSPLEKEYRCKIQMPVAQTNVSKRILSGYYKKKSHELINIKYCPMQPDIINDISEYIKCKAQELNISGYNEHKHKGLLKHIIYKISSDSSQILVIFVLNSNTIPEEIKKLSVILQKKYKQITGLCANFNTKKTNVIMGEKTQSIIGNDYYIESLDNIKYKISANSFFQVNPLCAKEILKEVKSLISKHCSNPSILDAYSGVSTFGIWLSDIAEKVVSIEEVKSASQDAIDSLKLNKIKNIEIINGDAAKEFAKLIKKGEKFDISVTDPPRKGCSAEAIENLVKLTKSYIVYVSCNPATLARDLKILQKHNYTPIHIRPADMFPNTYHIETIVLLSKQI